MILSILTAEIDLGAEDFIQSPNSRMVRLLGGSTTDTVNVNAPKGAPSSLRPPGSPGDLLPNGLSRILDFGSLRILKRIGVCSACLSINLWSSVTLNPFRSRHAFLISSTKNCVKENGPGRGVLALAPAANSSSKRPSSRLLVASDA